MRRVSIMKNTSNIENIVNNDSIYKGLFEDSPIAMWLEDFSELKKVIDKLKHKGIENFAEYLDQHPEIIYQCELMIKVIDINKKSLEVFKARNKEEIIDNIKKIIKDETAVIVKEELVAIAEGRNTFESEGINYKLNGEKMFISLRWTVLPGYENDCSRVIVSIIDITEQKVAEQQRNMLIMELQSALNKVKNLSGLLPICSSCKKIRDDRGYWQSVENFLQKHTDVDFSHSICPACAKSLYPEMFEDNNK